MVSILRRLDVRIGLLTLAAFVVEIGLGGDPAGVAGQPVRSRERVTAVVCHELSLQGV
jgi:hypothetical protein